MHLHDRAGTLASIYINGKTFQGETFRDFCGISLNREFFPRIMLHGNVSLQACYRESFPLESFAVYAIGKIFSNGKFEASCS